MRDNLLTMGLLSRQRPRHVAAKWIAISLFIAPSVDAFTFQTAFTDGCHEELTLRAWSRVKDTSSAHALIPQSVDPALVANLPFDVPQDLDAWTLALLIGARQPDMEGAWALDLVQLASAHLPDAAQPPHCLRTTHDDYQDGDEQAIERCREEILQEIAEGLVSEAPMVWSATESVPVPLKYQISNIPVIRLGYRLGRALHALQDSFSHTYRSDDLKRMIRVFNYTDPITRADYDPSRDGDRHRSDLDGCSGTEVFQQARMDAAVDASSALLAAVVSVGAADRAARLSSAEQALSEYFQQEAGCSASNHWCGAISRYPLVQGGGCSSSSGGPLGLGAVIVLFALFGLTRGSRSGRARIRASTATIGVMTLLAAFDVWASPAPDLQSHTEGFSARAAVGGSIDRGGMTAGTGVRWSSPGPLELGIEAELNPWFDWVSTALSPGTMNVYAIFSWRWAWFGGVSIKTTASLGASMLLFDMVGAPRGTVGPFLGISFLTMDVPLSSGLRLEVRPEMCLVAPRVFGLPVIYREYRLLLGAHWTL